MSKYLLFILLLLSVSVSTQFIYVLENNTNSSPDGSRENPYATIEDAINNFTANDTDIVLLGDSITLTELITFPQGVVCTIRPDVIPESQYFPFNLAPGSGLITYLSNFTLQNLNIIELDKNRDPLTNAFQMTKGTITFNRTYIADILYGASSYMLVYGGEDFVFQAAVIILDSQFENLNNVQIFVQQTQVIIRNSSFDNIDINIGGFITLYSNSFVDANLTVTDVNVTNSKFDYSYTNFFSGFIQLSNCTVNSYFNGLYVKNVTLVNSVPLIWLVSLYESVNNPTHFTILNTVVEDVFEVPDPQVTMQNTGIGLIFDLSGTTTLNLTNWTANNLQFEYDSMVRYSPDKSNFNYLWYLLPAVTISNVKISNSAGTNFLIFGVDSGLVENVELTNFSCISVDVAFPIFYFENANAVATRNFYGKDVYGAVLKLNEVYGQSLENFTFYNISTNQEFAKENQNIVQLIRDSSILSTGLNPASNMTTYVSNFNVFGFQAIDATSNRTDSNDTYMIVAVTELGETTFKDCYWYNVQMGSFLSTSMNILNIDNLTVDADPGLVPTTLPWHRVFQMVNINMLKFTNCRFSNIQNVVIFNFFNIQRSSLYSSVEVIDMVFENITLANNYANYWSSDTLYLSHFLLNSPLKPYKVTFNNSYFNLNKISNGIISTLESYQAEVIIQNCTFEENFAKMGGAAFAAQTMQDNQNIFTLINNTFRNNYAAGSGGVFSFVNTWYSATASNNLYINNNATANGGVGYVLSSKLTFFERNALYQNGYAGKLGGSWYLSTSNQEDSSGNIRPISFVNSTFKNSRALQSGGAIYIALGNLKITQCVFQNNTAAISGGDFFMVTFSSFTATNSNFSRGYAPQGAFLHADSLYGEIVAIQNCRIENYGSTSPTQTLIELNSGWLYVSDTVFNNISMPLIQLQATSAIFENVTINQVTCTSSSYSFCILQGTAMSLGISDTTITDVVSNADLIVLNSPGSNTTIDGMEVNGVTTTLTSTKNNLKQLFALRLYSAPQVVVENSVFESFINFSSIIVEKSVFQLSGSKFSNQNSRRLLFGLDAELETNLGESTQSTNESSKISAPAETPSDAEFSQFLIFTTSNATITKSSFSYNSGAPLVNGGAMKILGDSSTTGNYQILNSTFTGNQGYQGGAISVQGPFNSLTIESSNFTSNAAETSGGSIYFANSSVRLVPKIAYSIFTDNQAESGGAIFVGNQPLYIQSSTFDSNSARDGGAIASFSESSQIVTLSQSLFEDNTAYVGAALRALGTTNFDTATSTFKDNTAEIGGVLATNPTQLRLVIYEVDEYFLFLETIDAAYMLTHSGTKIIYDSKDPDSYAIIYQKTGRNPNFIFQFTFLDQLGENLPIIEEASIQISIKNYIVPRGSVTPGILGQSVYQFNDTTGYLFNTFSIRGNETSVITLSAQGSFDNTFIDQVELLTPLDWKITIGPCSIGEYYDDVNLLCTPCSSGTYSLGDPYQTNACNECPDDMTCLGGDIYFPVEGYWRISETSDNVVQCFNNEACLGGQQDSGRDVSLTGFCGAGYHGIACGNCDPGYAKFGTSQKCVNCSKNAGYYIRFILYLAIQIIIIIFATKVYLDKSNPNHEDLKSALIKAALIKIIVDFIQVLNLTSEFDFHWPSEINDFLEAITKITPTNKDALSVDCFIALAKGDNYDVFFIKLLLMTLQPVLFIIVATLIWMLVFRIQKKPIMNNPALRARLIMTSLVIVYVLQPGIIKSTFQLFNCANYGPTDDPVYYLVEDTNVQCWEPKHVTWTLALGIPSLIIWLIIPSAYLLYIVIRRRFTKNPEAFAKKYNVVFDTYREKHFYWEIVILLRKVLIIIFTVFLTYTYLQAYLSFITLIVAYIVQLFCKPFIYSSLNSAEKLSIFATGFILYTALFFVRTDGNDSLVPLFLVFDVIIGVIFLLYCLIVATRALKGRVARIKQRWKKFIGIDGTSKPGFVGKTIRKLLPEKPNNGEDLIVVHKEKQPLDSECDDLHKETEVATRPSVKHPSMVELLDPRTNRIRPMRSCSAEYPEESHYDPRLRSMKSIDGEMRIFSVRATETDLLNSFRGDSRRGSLRVQPILPSQILDFDDENKGHYRAGSMPDIGLDIVLEEAPTATLNKDMLKDDRFKDLDKVEIQQNIEEEDERVQREEPDFAGDNVFGENPHAKLKIEMLKDDRFKDIDKLEIHNEAAAQMTTTAGLSSPVMESEEGKVRDQAEFRLDNQGFEENPTRLLRKEMLKDERFKDLDKVEIQFEDEGDQDVVRKITMFTEEDEMVPLSALKDEDFRNSFDTNSLDVEIQKEEEAAASANNVKNEAAAALDRSHEVLSLSAIDPIQSYIYDDEGEEMNREGEIPLNEVSNTRNESSESPDIMTLSGVFGKHERHEPHSAA